MNKEVTIGFKNQNGFRIAPDSDITTGKVIVNGIEITSVEDWEKATNSLIKLEHNWNELKKWLEETYTKWENWYNHDLSNHDKKYYKEQYLVSKHDIKCFQSKMQSLERGEE